jgi:hypothetical protein
MMILGMDLLSPESLGGAGVSLGAVALYAFIRAAGKISVLADKIGGAFEKMDKLIDAQATHLKEEKRHHAVLEASNKEQVEVLHRLERGNSVPRPITGEHTPVPVTPTPL